MAFVLLLLSTVSAEWADIARLQRFVPVLKSQVFDKRQDSYPASLTVEVEWNTKKLDLDLEVNRDLFEPTWSLETYDELGNVNVVNDTALYMCHYFGTVRGVPDSKVVMSLCDEIGMRGTIQTNDFHIETQHAIPLSEAAQRSFHNQEHIIYDLKDVIVTEDRFDHVTLNDDRLGDWTGPPAGTRVAYRAPCQTASDSFRMNAYGSANAEAQNTQSFMNQAAARYPTPAGPTALIPSPSPLPARLRTLAAGLIAPP